MLMSHSNGCRFQKIRIFKDQEIGRGAYGMVCKAECDGLLCAAKLLHPVLTCERTVQSFHNECQILSSIKHPNIIQYLGTHEEGPGNPVLLMELLDTSLTALLEETPSSPPLPFHTEVNLCHDVSLALAYLHSNDIIHRDLSSNNVLLTKERKAKVTDFGMCKLLGGDQHVSRLTQVPGCAAYMPPEAQMDRPTYTYKLDSFSYGVLTVQMLTRKFPAPGPPRKRINDPQYGLHPIEVPIPEPERRESHIDLIDPSHPLLKVALVCLSYDEKDRPSSSEICSQVGEMKRSKRYREGVLQEAKGGATVELHRQFSSRDVELLQLRKKLESSEREKKMLKESIDELTSQLDVSRKESQSLPGDVSCGRETTDELRRTLSNKSKGSIADLMDKSHNDWRRLILASLLQRNCQEKGGFVKLIASHENLQAELNHYKANINRLEHEKNQLEKVSAHPPGKVDKRSVDQRALQRELMEVLRRRAELADKVCEMTAMVKDKEGELVKKDKIIREMEALVTTLRAESEANQQKYELELVVSKSVQEEHRNLQALYVKEREKIDELKKTVEMLRAENQELKNAKENKDKKLSLSRPPIFSADSARQLSTPAVDPSVERLSGDTARQHSSHVPIATHLLLGTQDQTHLSMKTSSPSIKSANFAICPFSNVHQFDAHESDVSALCFSPDGTCLATGGSDKVVKVWTLRPDMHSFDPNSTILSGSKASIVALQFDPTSKVVLAASNDNMARIWNLSDQACKHTLLGHSAKVMAAKFLAEDTQKVVTGSHDRTLKLWDLTQNSCFRTVFTGSSCNDVILVKGRSGPDCTLISGHLDKRIRFWDIRTNASASEITLPGKITSLDHFAERQLLLCCSQDDTLRLIDLRQNSITASFSGSGFKVGVDWSRACFSPDGQYVAAGSADGSVFVWEVASGRMKSKKEHTSAVVVCGWHPSGQLFASGDRSKKVVLWTS
eukprot:Em0016g960a